MTGNTGENNLRVHELMEQVEELKKSKQELYDQVEHWKFRAEEALESKALDVMTADQKQVTSATEDILLDIKKLQQVPVLLCPCTDEKPLLFTCSSPVDTDIFGSCRVRLTGGSRQSRSSTSMRRLKAMSTR